MNFETEIVRRVLLFTEHIFLVNILIGIDAAVSRVDVFSNNIFGYGTSSFARFVHVYSKTYNTSFNIKSTANQQAINHTNAHTSQHGLTTGFKFIYKQFNKCR